MTQMTDNLFSTKRRICILGGTGFVGEGVIPRLLRDGHEILLLVRSESEVPEKWKNNESISWVLGDATKPDSYQKAFNDFCPDTLIYLIGLVREFPKRDITWEKLHYQAFVDAVTLLKESLKKVIYMSADVARPEGTGYETTKWRAEEFIKQSRINYTIFRPTIIMAPSTQYHFTRVLKGLTRSPLIPLFGRGSFLLSPVSRDDVAEAFAQSLLFQKYSQRNFDLKGRTDCTYRVLLERIRDISGQKGMLIPIPIIFFKILGRVLGRFSWFPFTYDQITMLTRGIISDDEEIWHLMNHNPLTLEEILEQYRGSNSVE